MKKILKILAMLVVVAAIVFVAGCAEKTNTAKNENQAASGQVTPAETSTPAVTPAETSTPAVTTENMTEKPTGNNTAQTGTRISNTIRKQEIAMNHTLNSSTQSVKQKSD
jgi:inhibitor of cysteine peptidase